jgi:hypothetical protein
MVPSIVLLVSMQIFQLVELHGGDFVMFQPSVQALPIEYWTILWKKIQQISN